MILTPRKMNSRRRRERRQSFLLLHGVLLFLRFLLFLVILRFLMPLKLLVLLNLLLMSPTPSKLDRMHFFFFWFVKAFLYGRVVRSAL